MRVEARVPLTHKSSGYNRGANTENMGGTPPVPPPIVREVTSRQMFVEAPNTTPVYPYTAPTPALVMSMTSKDADGKSTPFLQRIRLCGPKDVIVRATGQVDDGAMRNCISKQRWDAYGHCLAPLLPSNTRIRVTSNQVIPSMGRWRGKVSVGGTEATATFEVFDCKGTFDVILGKPWLREVRAVHDYFLDTIVIGVGGAKEQLINEEPEIALKAPVMHIEAAMEQDTTSPTMPARPPRGWLLQTQYEEDKRCCVLAAVQKATTSAKLLAAARTRANRARKAAEAKGTTRGNESCDDELEAEWARIHLLQISDSPWTETKWGTFLGLATPREPDPEWTQWHSSREPRPDIIHPTQKAQMQASDDRRRLAADVAAVYAERHKTPLIFSCANDPLTASERRRVRTQEDTAKWHFHRKTHHVSQLFGIDTTAATDEDKLAALLQSEVRIQQLRRKLDTMREMAMPEDVATADVHAMGDVLDEAFTLNRGTNDSPRTQDPFSEA